MIHTTSHSKTIRANPVKDLPMSKTVILFTQQGCGPCQKVKEYLQNKKVVFSTKDIGKDKTALKELVEQYHSQSTPTTIINGQVVIGFNKDRIDKLLER